MSKASELVFITGGTGFIGLHVILQTLQAGYRVKAAVRTADGKDRVTQALSRAGVTSPNIEFVVVSDIIVKDAYSEALAGVTHVIHVASPLSRGSTDYQTDLIDPAIHGTTNILNAALKYDTIKRIVITSSIVTIIDMPTLSPENVYSENDKATTLIYDQSAPPFLAYIASKIFAQRATSDFLKAHPYNKDRKFDVVTIHPALVVGHNYVQTSYEKKLAGTNSVIWDVVAPNDGEEAVPGPPLPESTVSVIDVATAHVRGLDVQVKNHDEVEEFLLATPSGVEFSKIGKFAEEKFKGEKFDIKTKVDTTICRVNVERATNILGIKWRSFEQQMEDVIKQQTELYKKQ